MPEPSDSLLSYCPDLLHYARRRSRAVMVGNVGVGGENPIRVQSMITADTRDTKACVDEVLQLADAGCEIVRITAQTRVYAANLEHIAREARAAGCEVPLVADIHFKPDAALEAAKWVEKIRVNPGNYADKKKFEVNTATPNTQPRSSASASSSARWSNSARNAVAPCALAPTTAHSPTAS